MISVTGILGCEGHTYHFHVGDFYLLPILRAIHVHSSDPATGRGTLCVVNKTKANCDHGKHLEDKKVEEDDTME